MISVSFLHPLPSRSVRISFRCTVFSIIDCHFFLCIKVGERQAEEAEDYFEASQRTAANLRERLIGHFGHMVRTLIKRTIDRKYVSLNIIVMILCLTTRTCIENVCVNPHHHDIIMHPCSLYRTLKAGYVQPGRRSLYARYSICCFALCLWPGRPSTSIRWNASWHIHINIYIIYTHTYIHVCEAQSSCFSLCLWLLTREAKHKYQMERLMASARTEQTTAQLTIQDLQVQLKAQKVKP